jgi:hypothetical protein
LHYHKRRCGVNSVQQNLLVIFLSLTFVGFGHKRIYNKKLF